MSKYILVCGSKDYENHKLIYEVLDDHLQIFPDHIILVGDSSGADFIAREYALDYNISFQKIKGTDSSRDSEMIKLNPSIVLAFSSKSYLTSGIINIVTQAKHMNITVKEYLSE